MNRFQANLCILTAVLCWSLEVVLFKLFPAGTSVFAVLTLSFGLAAVALAIAFWSSLRARPSRRLLVTAGVLSVFDVASTGLAFAGSVHTTTPLALFLMSLYVLGVPLILLVMRRPVRARTWWGTVVITLGLCLIADLPSQVLAWSPVMLLLAAVALRSIVIVGVNDALKDLDPAPFAVYILGSGALVMLVAWVIVDPASMAVSNYSSEFVAALFMYSMFVIALYTGINFFGQQYASAPTVAVLYSTEVVFATLLSATLPSVLVDRIHLTAAMGVGCVLIVAGAVFAEVDVSAIWRHRIPEVAP